MNNSPKVSIIIPVYNVQDQLHRCIDSVVNQTYRNLEIILVDDGSSDESGIICDRYSEKDARVIAVHKENGGVSSARNVAFEKVSGEYVLFLDGDDSLDIKTVESCVRAAENRKYDIVVFGYHIFLEKDNETVWQHDDIRMPYKNGSPKDIQRSFVELEKAGYLGFVTDKLIRYSLIRDNNLRFDSYFDMGGEDGVFVIQLLPYIKSIKVIDKCLYNYYRRDNVSMTVSFKQGRFERYYKRLEITSNYMREHDSLPGEESFLLENYCKYILWTYESMFSPTCRLTAKERHGYISSAFKPKDLYKGFYKDLKQYIKQKDIFTDYSRSSRLALKWIINNHYFLTFLLHEFTLRQLGG